MRLSATITITAGTPVSVATALGLDAGLPIYARRWTAQALVGGSGIIYVEDGIKPRGRVPVSSVSGDLTGQLAAATASAPGGFYEDIYEADADNQGDIDLSLSWIDGSHTGDTVAVSANLKV